MRTNAVPTVADALRTMGRAAYYWRIYEGRGYYSDPALRVWGRLENHGSRMLHEAIIGATPVWGRDAYRLSPAAILRRAEAAARQHELGAEVAEALTEWRVPVRRPEAVAA